MNVPGSMICVGRSNCFRFNHPEEAERMKTILPNARISSVPLHFSSAAGEPPGNYDPPPHPVSSRGRISRGGGCYRVWVRQRINKPIELFLTKSRNIQPEARISVWSVAMHGTETWTQEPEGKNRIENLVEPSWDGMLNLTRLKRTDELLFSTILSGSNGHWSKR